MPWNFSKKPVHLYDFPAKTYDSGAFECILFGTCPDHDIVADWWNTHRVAYPEKQTWETLLARLPSVIPAETGTWGGIITWFHAGKIRFVVFGNATAYVKNQRVSETVYTRDISEDAGRYEETYIPSIESKKLYVEWNIPEHPVAATYEPGRHNIKDPAKDATTGMEQFQSGWDDLFTYGVGTGSFFRRSYTDESSDMSEWTAKIGWIILLPALRARDMWLKQNRNQNRMLAVGVCATGIFSYTLFMQAFPEKTPLFRDLSADTRIIAEQQLEVEQALIYADRERARTLLDQNDELLEHISDPLLRETQERLRRQLENIETSADETMLIAQIGEHVGAALLGNTLLVLGVDNTVTWYDIEEKKVLSLTAVPDEISAYNCNGERCLVLTKTKLIDLDTDRSRLGQWKQEWDIPAAWPANVIDIDTYGNNMYLLVQENNTWQIHKASFGSRLGSSRAWNDPQPGVAGQFYVDFEIHVFQWPAGNGTGREDVWLRGKRTESYELDYGGPLAVSARLGAWSPDAQLWLDGAHNRIVHITENRSNMKQIIKTGWSAYRHLFMHRNGVLLVGKNVSIVSWPGFSGL